ncbi:methyltransferase domain-containing protein [Roseomonas sp. GC11]|uniref:CheR family methyltransferase n=1 Tax=Roseomonas sp. GC11 TaxID=2950546 RepID=UPI002109F424|nr:CheR family methyltransferase [Roseomonas sp. GC11]MCQ4162443.1 methyltransferase domain-containing protein [Roseomonas sp. GC11]
MERTGMDPARAESGAGADAGTEAEALAAAGLCRFAGMAWSEVLQGRLRRAAPLLAGAGAALRAAPRLEDPFWSALIDAVTVQETRLFRAAPQLLALPALVFPALRARGGPLRLLSAGCATGEEPWSLAVLAAAEGLAASVTGFDLCRPALERAATGLFDPGPPDPLREVPPAYHGFFRPGPAGLRARPGPAVEVAVARANLLDLPPAAAPFDVILCRNVLIYLTEEARAAVLAGLCARLAPGGALLLGATDRPPPGLGLRLWSEAHPALWRLS